jgi:ABC-type phosphate transport system ATPase subunit
VIAVDAYYYDIQRQMTKIDVLESLINLIDIIIVEMRAFVEFLFRFPNVFSFSVTNLLRYIVRQLSLVV